MRFLKDCGAQCQHVRVIVSGAPDNRQQLTTIGIADQRRPSVRAQVRADVINHCAQLFPVTLSDIDPVYVTKHERIQEQFQLQTMKAATRLSAGSAASSAQFQLTPRATGFCARQFAGWRKNSAPNFSSPVSAYARPSVMKCPNRFNSQTTRASEPSPRIRLMSP